MALDSYTTLKAAVADNAHRSDLTSQIVDFVTMAEARMYDDMILKDMESDESLTLTLGNNYVALPTGYISPIAFWLVLSNERLMLTPELPQDLPYNSTSSIPTHYAIDGVNIRFDCPAADNYSAKFRMVKKTALSGSVASNYILARRPDIYLAATMVELARYIKDVDLFNAWESKYIKASSAFKAAENRARAMVPMRTEFNGRRDNIISGQ